MKKVPRLQNKSRELGFVVRSSFLKTALIPILTIELILLGLHFFSNQYIVKANLELLRSNTLETISDISKTEARHIGGQLREVSRNNQSLQAEHQALFMDTLSEEESYLSMQVDNKLVDNSKSGNSSVFVSSNTALTSEVNEKILRTERMATRFATLVDNNPNLVAAHFISWDNVVRSYPLVEDFYEQFSYDFDLTKYNFYYLADEKHNPSRDAVWTDTYLDPAGKGWMLSNLTPVYQGEFLEGVNVLPVTLNTFSKYILSKDLQWRSGALVMDRHGYVLAMSRPAEEYIGLPGESDRSFKNNPKDPALTKPVGFNLLKQNTMTGMYFSEFFNGTDQSMEFTLLGEDYLVTKQVIPETGWQLFILTPLKVVFEPIAVEEKVAERIYLLLLGLIIVFYVFFFIYLRRTSERLAQRITKPIHQVTRMITSYDPDDGSYKVQKPVNITELDNLLSMNLKIQKAKIRYQRVSKEMEIKNKQLEVLAITDQLTQLYNRLKLDEVLIYEVARAQRDQTPLTVAIIDIDKFKLVNDTFGHQMGDSVLIGVSQIMLRNIRSTDILGRWGGEEFMLILPNTPLRHAYDHTNQLRKLVENASFSPVDTVTISIGVASMAKFVDGKMLVELADNALYEAKENGRNRVELAPMVAVNAEKGTSVTDIAYYQ